MAGCGGRGAKREEWYVAQGNGTIYWDREAWRRLKGGGVLRKMVWSAVWNTIVSQAGGNTQVSPGFRDRSVPGDPEGTGLDRSLTEWRLKSIEENEWRKKKQRLMLGTSS